MFVKAMGAAFLPGTGSIVDRRPGEEPRETLGKPTEIKYTDLRSNGGKHTSD